MSAALRIAGSGMCCAVGTSGPAARAAIRAGLSRFTESRFVDAMGTPITTASLPLGNVWGARRIGMMVEAVVSECVPGGQPGLVPERTALLLLVGSRSRPGHNPKWEVTAEAACHRALGGKPATQQTIAAGRVGLAIALEEARQSLTDENVDNVVIAAVDSYLTARTMNHMLQCERVLGAEARDGFIPGEGAAALLLRRADPAAGGWHVLGVGRADESARIDNEEPMRADGLAAAMRKALMDSKCSLSEVNFRIADIAGESFYFREAGMALSRVFDQPRAQFPMLHITDAVGETGAAIGPLSLAYLGGGTQYQGQRAIFHLANDDGQRAAVVLESRSASHIGEVA